MKVKVKAMVSFLVLTFVVSVWGQKSDLSLVIANKSDVNPASVFRYSCGDIDMTWLWGICVCGDELIYPFVGGFETYYYCCTPPSVKCNKTFYGAICPEGQVLEIFHSHNQGDI